MVNFNDRPYARTAYNDPDPVYPLVKEYDDTQVSPEVKNYVKQLTSKMSGVDTREVLRRAVETIDLVAGDAKDTSVDTKARQDDVENRFDDQIAGNTDIDEVIDARRPEDGEAYPTLRRRLDEEHQKVTTQLNQIHVNVKDYGAIGDGVTDDWQAITDAMTHAETASYGGGSVLFFPRGNYRVTKTIEHKRGVTIKSLSRAGATLNGTDILEGPILDGSLHNSKLVVEDIGFLGNPNIDAIYMNNANGSYITNVLFTTAKNGIHSFGSKTNFTDGSWGVSIQKCYFHDMHEYGVNLKYGSNMVSVTDNQFWKSANGVLVRNGYADTIKNNIIQEMTGIGVNVESTNMATIETNYFERNGKDVVITKAPEEPAQGISYKIEVLNNFFVSGTSNIVTTIGVDVVNARQTVIKGNWTREHATAFVVIGTNSQQTKIEDNYSHYETVLIDNGLGTIYKRLFDDKEVLKGKFELEGMLQLQDESTFRLGNRVSNTSRTVFYDENLGLLSIRDGLTQRKAGYPAGAKSITSAQGSSIEVSGTGAPDRFPVQLDIFYNVHLTADKPVLVWYSNKTTTGFTINIGTPDDAPIPYPVNVSWTISRQ